MNIRYLPEVNVHFYISEIKENTTRRFQREEEAIDDFLRGAHTEM